MAKPEFEDVAQLLMAGAIKRQPAFWPRRSMWTMASMARAPADALQLCRWCRRPQWFMWTMASITRAAAVATPLCCWYCWCGVTTIVKLGIVQTQLEFVFGGNLKSCWSICCGFFYTIATTAKPEFEDVARLLMAGAIERQPAFWPQRSMWMMALMARAPADASQLCRWCRWPWRFMWMMASITRAAAVATPLCCWYCWCGVTTIVKLSTWVASRLCDCNATSRLKSLWIRKFFFMAFAK
jgi:hypothetical protein